MKNNRSCYPPPPFPQGIKALCILIKKLFAKSFNRISKYSQGWVPAGAKQNLKQEFDEAFVLCAH